ncbi:HK97 family phage prohead protease [Nocardioides antri]|uniref:Prohead serine protease domain-containing protein n=1 Tax=Nocardioides antri TaxID=2607659 RepID=A0A5B1LXK9_9ACTN|nr:HK97 family phage prohead protease [Nocardioides antri]KAA1424317.1 hypothetical protein F0U47_18970 [Nocardioides antri]
MSVTAIEQGLILPKRFAEVQQRSVEAVDVDDATGEVRLRAVPYEYETQLGEGLFELFERGAFANASKAPTRCKFFHNHNGPLIGHAREVEDRADGVYATMKFASTLAAQEARVLTVDGFIDQCSIEFRVMRDHVKVARKPDGLHVRHARGHLLGVALVNHGAYADQSAVLSAREADLNREREEIIARLRSLNH